MLTKPDKESNPALCLTASSNISITTPSGVQVIPCLLYRSEIPQSFHFHIARIAVAVSRALPHRRAGRIACNSARKNLK